MPVALVLLGLPAVSCVPPDFVVESDANRPVSIDRKQLHVSPDELQNLSGCPPLALELDVTPAVENPDKDQLFSAWLVNDTPISFSTNGTKPFTFDPCSTVVQPGAQLYRIESIVLDGAPSSFDSAEEIKTPVDPTTTYDNVVWFVAVEDTTCCGGGQ